MSFYGWKDLVVLKAFLAINRTGYFIVKEIRVMVS